MPDLQNRRRGERFVELVQLVMRANGIDATARPRATTLAAAIDPDNQRSDLVTPDWSISAYNQRNAREWSAGLDAALKAAEHDSRPFAAAVWFRPERDAGSAYVVLQLDTFTAVLREGLQPQIGAAA